MICKDEGETEGLLLVITTEQARDDGSLVWVVAVEIRDWEVLQNIIPMDNAI